MFRGSSKDQPASTIMFEITKMFGHISTNGKQVQRATVPMSCTHQFLDQKASGYPGVGFTTLLAIDSLMYMVYRTVICIFLKKLENSR
jgi:hypothetical protein